MEGVCMKQTYVWSLHLVAEWEGLAIPIPTYCTPFHRINKHCWVPLKCNCAFWPKGCLACHPVTSKLTAKIMQNCEGEQKRSGSLIKSCHGPLKIFSQERGEKYILQIFMSNVSRLGPGGSTICVRVPIPQERLLCGCHLITDNS